MKIAGLWGLVLSFFLFLFLPEALASELEPKRIPEDCRYLVHLDVQQALKGANGKALERLWLKPLLDAYGTIVCPELQWNTKTLAGITYWGDGIYTNHADQVYLFKPASTNWYNQLKKNLHPEVATQYGYRVGLKKGAIYVSQNPEKLKEALQAPEAIPPLLKGVTTPKGSSINLVFDHQVGEMLALPLSAELIEKEVKCFRLNVSEKENLCWIDLCFDLRESCDEKAFKKQIERTLKVLQLTGLGWGSVLENATVSLKGKTVLVRECLTGAPGKVPQGYYVLLQNLFGVSENSQP